MLFTRLREEECLRFLQNSFMPLPKGVWGWAPQCGWLVIGWNYSRHYYLPKFVKLIHLKRHIVLDGDKQVSCTLPKKTSFLLFLWTPSQEWPLCSGPPGGSPPQPSLWDPPRPLCTPQPSCGWFLVGTGCCIHPFLPMMNYNHGLHYQWWVTLPKSRMTSIQ